MKRSRTNWRAPRRGWGLLAALGFCLALGGCNSIRFGSTMSDSSSRAGEPVIRAQSTSEPPLRQRITGQESVSDSPLTTHHSPLAAVQVIDLPAALARAGADNPTIALAEEAVRASLAERMQARALLFPSLDVGANLRIHHGNYLSGRGVITDVNIQSLYWGFGADAKGGGTVAVPGVRLVSHLADAWYAPQAAQQKVVQSRFDSAATRQYLLMEVGVRYLALVEAQAQQEAYRQSRQDFEAIEKLTVSHAKAGQGREADAERARSETLLLRADAQRAEEALGVAAAELARLIEWDPAVALRGAERVPPLLELVDPNIGVPTLLQDALANHPEITARSADVAHSEIILRQERMRPFLPVIAVGFSASEFSGQGPNSASRLGNSQPRTDFDVVAVWSLQNLGAGNRAIQNVARSDLESAQIERLRVLDRIRREVVEARALVVTRRQEIDLARKRVETSQRAYTQDLKRAMNPPQGRPIEVLDSAKKLSAARQDLVHAMIGYSQAQLQLYAALGSAP